MKTDKVNKSDEKNMLQIVHTQRDNKEINLQVINIIDRTKNLHRIALILPHKNLTSTNPQIGVSFVFLRLAGGVIL
jgi:predicted metal-dependent TIM-barrel fold hydrolase